MYIKRRLSLEGLLKTNSVFLFGPRQTGKSSLIKNELQKIVDQTYNLLDQGLLRRLIEDPTLIRQEQAANNFKSKVICIDEIQKCPALLNEVHLLIEDHGLRFLLTGSSARRLRQSGVNLLGGRARDRKLYPLTSIELGKNFDLLKAFRSGLIPSHYLNENPDEALHSYTGRYLSEEIAAEGFARNLPGFTRFLSAV